MTKAKGKRRLLLRHQDSASVSEALDWLEWATAGEDPRAAAADQARLHYLHAITRETRRALDELQRISADDATAIAEWVARWRLGSWAIAWARATIQLSGGRYWCPPTDGEGAQLATPAPVQRTRTPAEIARTAPLVHAKAFEWLAQYQVLEHPFTTIAIRAQTCGNAGASAGSVRRDCMRLAALLDMPIRITRPGRPAKAKKF
jgi:hypothetical protein